ncbi:uncharacterized protein LY79DRAFT_298939 [Colletotrichum navitas]|uniref:Uncharacterized protein n=1 Tax=Colletotrichum navitas TaxID=681940 RepID=A0AAD8PV10_9PEZI|nr:uncharacterized protein LY79DRAFT_298939 [Colletotrichum navitas]KAK1580619.1 hypothetical protein LY79DRAFT_298939 [Colletotrichum navitas]
MYSLILSSSHSLVRPVMHADISSVAANAAFAFETCQRTDAPSSRTPSHSLAWPEMMHNSPPQSLVGPSSPVVRNIRPGKKVGIMEHEERKKEKKKKKGWWYVHMIFTATLSTATQTTQQPPTHYLWPTDGDLVECRHLLSNTVGVDPANRCRRRLTSPHPSSLVPSRRELGPECEATQACRRLTS